MPEAVINPQVQPTQAQEVVNPNDLSMLAYHPATTNGLVTRMFASKTMGVSLDLQSLVLELKDQVDQMQAGDKSKTEAILYSQVLTLNAIFLEMARRAALNMNEHINSTEAYMRMALKAQNQVRLTLETLASMKNPPVVIAKQANISAGHQQVNNVLVDFRQQETQPQPTQLSGEVHELRQNP